jgi:hypothetical protein
MKHHKIYILLICSVFLLSSCATSKNRTDPSSPEQAGDEQQLILKSILVLPTEHKRVENEFNTAEIKALNQGAQTLDNLLRNYFMDKPTVSLLSSTQANSLLGSYIGNQFKEAQYIGKQAKADAVLICQIYRFRELDGKEYGANEPASVSFDYQLLHSQSGRILCRGTYDETQQTLFANLFKFGKASKRKFKFVKGADLLQEGIEEKFSQCSHLMK